MLNVLDQLRLFITFGKEGDTMIAMLWAQRIMNGKKTYNDVPRLLKEQVLIESGVEFLVTETPAQQ